MTRMELYRTPTVDEAFEALKKSDPVWLETTILEKWRQSTAPSTRKTVNSQEPPSLASTYLGPHDVTAPAYAESHELSAHLVRFREFDWSSTELGPISAWPSTLRTWVNVCMADPRAVAIWWGPNRVCLYNETYQHILAGRNSWALGKPLEEVWFDLDANTTRLRNAFGEADATGTPSCGANTCFFVERSGFLEEAWCDWAVIPIMGPAGEGNLAYYNPCSENTREVLYDRRMATLLSVEHETSQANELKELGPNVLMALRANSADIPFAAWYSVDEESLDGARRGSARSNLSGSTGTPPIANRANTSLKWVLDGALELEAGQLGLPASMTWDLAIEIWGPMFAKAVDNRAVQLLDSQNDTFPQALRSRCFSRATGDLCSAALIIPVAQHHRGSHRGFLFIGINPRSFYDQAYQKFISLLSSQLRRSMNSLCLSIEQVKHAEREAELTSQEHALLSEKLSLVELDAETKEMRFRRMADMALVGMFIVEPDGSLSYANNTWYEMTAYPRGDFPALDWVRVIHEDDRGWFADKWDRLTRGETLQFEIRFVKPYISDDYVDGERLEGTTWAAAAAYAEFKDGKVANVVGTVVDISRHKWVENFQERRTAEALELKRQQEAFMDMTSHETRNPLSAISLCVESIVETCESILVKPDSQLLVSRDTLETTLEGANTILNCVNHQKTIIDDVLTLSKLNSGLLKTSPVEVQPSREVSAALKILEAELQQADIDAELTIDASYHRESIDYALLDPVRLRQILLNLVSNAIKFTKDEACRSISIRLAASTEPPTQSVDGVRYLSDSSKPAVSPYMTEKTVYLLISVKDTGRGIDKHELDHLFQRFRQGSPRTHIKYGGSGLGLFICKELARLQGGQIGAISERGVGSTFAFYIKATKCPPPKELQTASPENYVQGISMKRGSHGPEINGQCGRKKLAKDCHILLVEDNLVNQRVMAQQLRRAGYTVEIANHGQEALDHINTTHFARPDGAGLDIVLCDVEMPVMNGLECSRQIRQLQQDGKLNKSLPLIAVTANVRGEQQQEALDAGFNSVITKPFRMNALLPELEKHCLRT